jgi:hypothetical protein
MGQRLALVAVEKRANAIIASIFIHNGAPQALVGCHENRMAELKRYA